MRRTFDTHIGCPAGLGRLLKSRNSAEPTDMLSASLTCPFDGLGLWWCHTHTVRQHRLENIQCSHLLLVLQPLRTYQAINRESAAGVTQPHNSGIAVGLLKTRQALVIRLKAGHSINTF
jgi:hypothetical protein